jgi:hypothetical protein
MLALPIKINPKYINFNRVDDDKPNLLRLSCDKLLKDKCDATLSLNSIK